MILLINLTEKDQGEIGLWSGAKKVKIIRLASKDQPANQLLSSIDRLLQSAKIKPAQLSGLAVATGPGGFTTLRVAVATANALAWAWRQPLAGLPTNSFDSLEQMGDMARQKIKAIKPGLPVAPAYGQEPKINAGKK